MDLISIVVPVYGVEKYVEQCIDSLLRQTYKNIEILLIDDGSKDRSGEICDRLALTDSRIKVFHKINEGLSVARNYGFTRTQGEFICFVDSDDYVEPDYCERLYNALLSHEADVAICYESAFEDGDEIRKDDPPISEERVENYEEFVEHFLDDFRGPVCWVWNKMYRKNALDKIRFVEGKVLEDVIYIVDLSKYLKKAVWIPYRLVNYRQRKGSVMHSLTPSVGEEWISALQYEYDEMKKTDSRESFHLHHGVRVIREMHQVYLMVGKTKDPHFREFLNQSATHVYNDLDWSKIGLFTRIKCHLLVKRMCHGSNS